MADQKQVEILHQGIETWNQWRLRDPGTEIDLSESDLRGSYLIKIHLIRANLKGADLRGADLKQADLIRADLFEANLSEADLSGADLRGARLIRSDLQGADLRGADLRGTDLSEVNLSEADLSGANLRGAILNEAYLSRTDFSQADLSEAYLSRAQALATIFTQAILTGACVQDWVIDAETHLETVICDYIYLKQKQQERRPRDERKVFAPGQLARLFQLSASHIDLVFRGGINWRAFLIALFQVQVEQGARMIFIRGLEALEEQGLMVRLNIPANVPRDEIEAALKHHYQQQFKLLEDRYRIHLQLSEAQLKDHYRQGGNLLQLLRIVADQPLQSQTETSQKPNSRSNHGSHSSQGDGNVVEEIQTILTQLAQLYTRKPEDKRWAILADVLQDRAQTDPHFRQRLLQAFQQDSVALVQTLSDNPFIQIPPESIQDWLNLE